MKEILKNIKLSLKQIEYLLEHLKPRNETETSAIKLINDNLSVIRGNIRELLMSQMEHEKSEGDTERLRELTPNSPPIEEMTAMAGGGVMGQPGSSNSSLCKKCWRIPCQCNENISYYENKSLLKKDAPILTEEEKKVFKVKNYIRSIIRESIGSLYKENKNILKEFDSQNSTGAVRVNQFFGEIREQLEKEYMSLKTSKDQRESFGQHIIKAVENELSMPNMSGKVSSNLSQKGQNIQQPNMAASGELPPSDGAEAEKKAKIRQFSIGNMDPTGRNIAFEFFEKIIKTKLDKNYSLLENYQDKFIFKTTLLENLEALFSNLEEQMGSPGEGQTETPLNMAQNVSDNSIQNNQTRL